VTRVLLVHNPDAGQGGPDAHAILRMLEDAGHTPTYQSSSLHDMGCAVGDGYDLVVAAGGDGTVCKVLRVCAGTGVPVAMLPLGTANNIASGLGHAGGIEDLIARWDLSRHRTFHLGVARGPWGKTRFAESFGVGVLAEMIARAAPEHSESFRGRAHKLRAVAASLRKTLRRLDPQRITVWVGDEGLTGNFLWVEATRVGLVGANLAIGRAVDPWDPTLEIVTLDESERDRFLDYLDHDGEPDLANSGLVARRGTRASVSWERFEAQADGSILPSPRDDDAQHRAEIGVRPHGVQVLTLDERRGAGPAQALSTG